MRPHRPLTRWCSPSSRTVNGYARKTSANVASGGVPGSRQRTTRPSSRVSARRTSWAARHSASGDASALRWWRVRTAGRSSQRSRRVPILTASLAGRRGGEASNKMAVTSDPSTKELVQEFAQQTSTLVRKELALAQVELKEKGKRAGIGGGLFGAPGVLALYGLGTLIAFIVLLLATAMDAWLAALIIAVVLFAAAGVAALVGKGQVQKATPPAPEQAIESTKRDVQEVRDHARRP